MSKTFTHVDDWIDSDAGEEINPDLSDEENLAAIKTVRAVKDWLNAFRASVMARDLVKLQSVKVFCNYIDGVCYRVTGCSRLGDVWLSKDHSRSCGYSLRVDIKECSQWKIVPATSSK